MRIRLRLEARLDIYQTSCFYDEKSPGWGGKFVQSIYEDLERLESLAGIHAKRGRYYRILSQKFPFTICYELDGDEIVVIAVLSCRMHPRIIDAILDDR